VFVFCFCFWLCIIFIYLFAVVRELTSKVRVRQGVLTLCSRRCLTPFHALLLIISILLSLFHTTTHSPTVTPTQPAGAVSRRLSRDAVRLVSQSVVCTVHHILLLLLLISAAHSLLSCLRERLCTHCGILTLCRTKNDAWNDNQTGVPRPCPCSSVSAESGFQSLCILRLSILADLFVCICVWLWSIHSACIGCVHCVWLSLH
jgi:hypothetical protein